jgi:hypothetical protein
MKAWEGVSSLHFGPAPGADITKVIFAEFRWTAPDPSANR